MKLETWTALASLGMSVLFVALVLSFYNFLIGPEGDGPERYVDPPGLMMQQISIAAAPAIILAVVAFAISRGSGNQVAGLLLLGGGAIMAVGMYFGTTMLPLIKDEFTGGIVRIAPYLFMPVGAGIAVLGIYLTSKRTQRTSHLDDFH